MNLKHDFTPPTAAEPRHGADAYHCRKCSMLLVGNDGMSDDTYAQQDNPYGPDGSQMFVVSCKNARTLPEGLLPPCTG